jgi:hypothetical protein
MVKAREGRQSKGMEGRKNSKLGERATTNSCTHLSTQPGSHSRTREVTNRSSTLITRGITIANWVQQKARKHNP